jgi:hypothetical protein
MKTHRRIAALLTTVGALAAVGAAGAPAYASYHQIANYGSGLCAGISSWELYNNGATVVQQQCTGSPEQLWADVPLGGGYHRFVNGRSGKCMDVRDGQNADRTPVQQWACTNYSGMAWLATVPSYVPLQIKSGLGGRCLDVRGGSLQAGAVIQLYRCTSNNPAQLWTIT